jgi:hypothetical protein
LSLVTRVLGRTFAVICNESLQGVRNQGFRHIPVDFLYFVTQHAKAWRRSVACARAFNSGAMAALSYAAAGSSNSSSYTNGGGGGGGGVAGSNSNSPAAKSLGESKSSSSLSAAAAAAASSPSQSNSRRSLRFSNATGASVDTVRSAYPQNNTLNLL